jgi:hypothetical protein
MAKLFADMFFSFGLAPNPAGAQSLQNRASGQAFFSRRRMPEARHFKYVAPGTSAAPLSRFRTDAGP